MKQGKDLYRVVVNGREVGIEKVAKTDADFAEAERSAKLRITEAMELMREQEADPSKLDATHYFVGEAAARDFARMCYKDIEEEISANRDRMER